jgi:hypothetical protein
LENEESGREKAQETREKETPKGQENPENPPKGENPIKISGKSSFVASHSALAEIRTTIFT